MSHAFVIGDQLVSSEELSYKIALGDTKQLKIESDRFAQAVYEFRGDIEKGGMRYQKPELLSRNSNLLG